MRALVGLVIALGLLWPVIGLIVGSMAGNLTLEDDSKWLEGLILGLAGRFDGAESQAQERRWGRHRRGTWPPMAGGINT